MSTAVSSRELASCFGSFSFQPACRRLLFRLYSVYYFLYRFRVQETSAHRIFLSYILASHTSEEGRSQVIFVLGMYKWPGYQAPFLYSLDIFAANFKPHLSHFFWGLRRPNLVTLCINFVRKFFSCCKTVKTKGRAFQTIDNYIKLLPC